MAKLASGRHGMSRLTFRFGPSRASDRRVGWWAICGDLPTDYCSAGADCRHPRLAVKKIAEEWRDAVSAIKPGDTTIGDTDLSVSLAPLLEARTKMLLEFAADPNIWPDQPLVQ